MTLVSTQGACPLGQRTGVFIVNVTFEECVCFRTEGTLTTLVLHRIGLQLMNEV